MSAKIKHVPGSQLAYWWRHPVEVIEPRDGVLVRVWHIDEGYVTTLFYWALQDASPIARELLRYVS